MEKTVPITTTMHGIGIHLITEKETTNLELEIYKHHQENQTTLKLAAIVVAPPMGW